VISQALRAGDVVTLPASVSLADKTSWRKLAKLTEVPAGSSFDLVVELAQFTAQGGDVVTQASGGTVGSNDPYRP
jgi:hypothetical protein